MAKAISKIFSVDPSCTVALQKIIGNIFGIALQNEEFVLSLIPPLNITIIYVEFIKEDSRI
jgi:hypothetical protein